MCLSHRSAFHLPVVLPLFPWSDSVCKRVPRARVPFLLVPDRADQPSLIHHQALCLPSSALWALMWLVPVEAVAVLGQCAWAAVVAVPSVLPPVAVVHPLVLG